MFKLFIPDSWSGTLDDLVLTANRHLPTLLPPDRPGREINARLVRHYTTGRLLDEPLKQGREARYIRRHLLQLLTLRKLMAEGFGAGALQSTLQTHTDQELEALLTGRTRPDVQPGIAPPSTASPSNPALDFLRQFQPTDNEREPPRAVLGLVRASTPPDRSAEPYTRVTLAPGLELHVRGDFRLPRDEDGQTELTLSFLQALRRLRRP
jgi:hypothetical protein